jgi:tellurite resistance protein TerC
MPLLWLGFFALVALLLVLDLAVLHRTAKEPTVASAAGWTAAWMALGLAFAFAIFVIYENHWNGFHHRTLDRSAGEDASVTYLSAYLLEWALSVDNLFVMAVIFRKFSVPPKYQHRVLFWGIVGAIGFRFALLGGGAFVVKRFQWIFYVLGAYLLWQGLNILREALAKDAGDPGDDDDPATRTRVVRVLRRLLRIADGDHGGRFSVVIDGRRALTTLAVCLVAVELADIVFAFDSIPAVLSISQDTFIMVTSNVFAVLGLRSMYFVLVAAMNKLKYLSLAVGVLVAGIGVKMVLHEYVEVSHGVSLIAIAGVLAVGIIASVISTRRKRSSDLGPRSSA